MKIKLLNERAVLPIYATEGSAAFDLHSTESVALNPDEHRIIGSGIAMEIPEGYVGLLFARSGNSIKKSLNLKSGVSVIDSDYRGEVGIPLHNEGTAVQQISVGDRIAQMVILPYSQVPFEVVDSLEDTERGTGGFGSTGMAGEAV